MPQKSVLTGNILKLSKIYEANRTGKIMVFFAQQQHTAEIESKRGEELEVPAHKKITNIRGRIDQSERE